MDFLASAGLSTTARSVFFRDNGVWHFCDGIDPSHAIGAGEYVDRIIVADDSDDNLPEDETPVDAGTYLSLHDAP